MKKLLAMLFLVAFAWTSYAQLSTEGFNGATFPPTGWTTTPAGSGLSFAQVTAGTYPTTSPYSGTGMIKVNSFNYSTGTALLVSPPLNLTANPTFSVSFWMYRDGGYASSGDKIDVMVNTTASTSGATTIGTVNRSMTLAPVVGALGWYQYTFTIPGSFSGTTNYVILSGTTAYGNNMYLDDVALPFSAPGVAANVSPASGATGTLTTATLNWTAPTTAGPIYGYKLYFGTDNPPTNIANGTDLGNVLLFDPTPDMANNTTYYWKVVPYNGAGNASGASTWSFTTLAGFGTLQGFVLNCYGVPVEGATVAAVGPATYTTLSAVDGKYQFVNIPAANYTLGATKVGYNTVTVPGGVVVNPSAVTDKNITLTQPGMTVLPNPNNVSISPNEYFNGAFTVTNPGCGPLNWTASIGGWSSSNHSWFSMPTLTGTVNASSNVNVPAYFDATGLAVGTLLSATVTFTPNPAIGPALVVPVNMVVGGSALVPVASLTGSLTNQFTGAVTLNWECTPGAGFLYYTVKRDGTQIAIVSAATTYNDVLPTYGVYNYCVDAIYTDGATAPVCTSVEWPNPTMTWTPSALAATVWTNTSKNVDLSIGNSGLGTLAFEFPAYVDHSSASPLAYCTAGSTVNDEFISHVTFNTINNGSAGYPAGGYTNFTAISTDLVKGASYPISVVVGPPYYTGDIVGVWIDYDHNSAFDASEFTALSGLPTASGAILVPTSALSGPTTMRVRMQYNGTLSPCGTTTYGETEDYSVNIMSPTFITAVTPASGFVAAGAAPQPVLVTFSATDDYAAAGVYVKQLLLTSNDLAHASVSITSTMTVTVPGTIAGVVTDGVTGNVIPGVMVQAGTYSATTNDDGAYSLQAEAGTYSVVFTKIGYQTVTVASAVVTAGNVTTVNAQMFEQPYAPSCASASVNATDTQADVTWCVPNGPYELLYDDGSAENFAAWQLPGNMNAVKFTPKGYPATVVGAKLFVGDGSFPAGGVINGAGFGVAVFNTGANGMPGTMLDSVAASVTNYGWIDVSGLNAVVTSGDFFIVMIQGTMSPNCAPIGVDETTPKAYKSYSRNVSTNSPWGISPYQDFMMHAVVSSPIGGDDDAMAAATTVIPRKVAGMISQSSPNAVPGKTGMRAMVSAPEGYDNMDAVSKYSLSRIFLGAATPVAPAAGVFTLINNALTATTYTDGGTTWAGLAQGWYAYGVKAVYPNGQESPFVYTGAVPHKLYADLTINVKLVCGFVPAVGANVTLVGTDYPHDVLTAIVPASGTVFFDNMIKGKYDLTITKVGYTPFTLALNITGNKTIDAVLEDIRYMPRDLFVDDMTLVATWKEPLAYAIQENFEGGVFPPAGWAATTQGSVGWYASTNGSSSAFAIPNHTTYAVANDDAGGSGNNGCCDYLITPALDLTNAPSYALSFASYYTGTYGQMAYVEMSTDNGTSWTPVYTVTAATSWQQVEVDLSAYSGATGLASVKFAFHADDAAQWASGWAIDDVVLASGGVPVQGYGVFLDASEVGQTQELTWTYDPASINFGQTYVAGVAGLYCSGYSDLDTYTFTSHFLYPPRNLVAVKNVSTTSGAVILTWDAPIGGDSKIDASYPAATVVGVPAEKTAVASSFIPTSTGATRQTDANVLFDNGTIVNSPGTGPGGSDESIIPAGGSTYGFGLNQAGGLSVADDFVVPASWTITSVNFQGYQTNSGTTSTFTGAYFRIYDGDPSAGGVVVWGDFTTNHMTTTDFTNIYRVNAPGEGTARPVMNVTCNGLSIVLAPGTYWIEWALTGSGSSGPWVPNVVDPGNSLQNTGTWAPLTNPGPVGLPFTLSGTGGGSTNNALVGYHIFRDDASLVQVPPSPLTYWDLNLAPATYCYDITAVYDVSAFGFPAGTLAESSKEGTACADVNYGFDLPFNEDWTTGQFDVNLWTVGQNWVMDGQVGDPLPSAKFKWDPLLTNYSESLESFYMNATTLTTTTPYKIWLDFDLKLDDRTASTKELLTVEVWNGVSWKNVKEFANNGDFDWTMQHIDISTPAKHNVFKVRFRANGDLTGDIFSWAVDNIHIYVGYVFNPPLNLVATAEGTPKNDIKLTWSPPAGGGSVMSYILDDNTSEGGVYLNGAGEAWLGNEFAVSDAGVLQSAAVYMTSAGGSAIYTIDVFNEAQVIVGSSAAFTPTFDDWTTVALPDVPFAGTFYVMIHMIVSTQSDNLAFDTNGPNAASNPEWVYDATGWTKLTDYGFAPCVDFVRATGLVGGKKTSVTFNAGRAETNYVSPMGSMLAQKPLNVNTGNEVAHATYLGDNSDAMLGYNVYRRAYAVFPAGQNTAAAGTWSKINPAVVVPTEYLDMNLSNLVTNCYEYQVKAVYDEGESDPTNIDWECIFVGVNPNLTNEVSVYPNPATTYVRIDLTKEVNSISVYNSLGSVVVTKNVKGENSITLNTANYASGAYSVKFTTTSGDTFSRKFVVTK